MRMRDNLIQGIRTGVRHSLIKIKGIGIKKHMSKLANESWKNQHDVSE